MTTLPFSRLYACCLAVCFGAVEALRAGWEPEPPPPAPPQPVEQVALAVPPRPEGVRPVQGSGDDTFVYTEQKCVSLDDRYRDICYHQLSRQRALTDLDGALDACARIAEDDVSMECRADAAELHARVDRARSLDVCPAIARKKWRDQCVFGIAIALSHDDPAWAFRLCDDAGQWRNFCRHDVNGEISQFDVDLALSHCAAEEGDLLMRKSCWHGIGKYVARVDVDGAFAACARVPLGPDDLYRENCYHGLGWGAAETAGVGFVADCARAGEKADSCMLGVAYNLRRFDVDGALGICDRVGRADLHDQCVRFAREGRL